ncbi:MAG TPA: hypothetical protein VIS96_11960 [Terrimicrobiaceae bacterium]
MKTNPAFGDSRIESRLNYCRSLLLSLLCSVIAVCSASSLRAGTTAQEQSVSPPIPVEEASIFHVLIQNQFSNYYITPRGLIVQDEGLVWQSLALVFAEIYKGSPKAFINHVGLTVGVWNSVHSKGDPLASTTPHWNEFDFIAGADVTFLKDVNFSLTYLLFVSPNDAYESPNNLELALKYSDHFLEGVTPWGKLSINPYAKLFIELENKATVSATSSSFNFELGLIPKYVLNGYPLAIELPSFITLPGAQFYSEPGVPGLITTGVKVTAPLTFIPKKYGSWSIYGGVQYYHIFNDGLALGNTFLPSSSTNRNPVQFYGGLTLFF